MLKTKSTKVWHNILFGIAALGLISTGSLFTSMNVSAKDGDEGFPERIVKVEGLPEGTHLVTDSAFNGHYDVEDIMAKLFGDKYFETVDTISSKIDSGEIEVNSKEFYQILFGMYDEIGVIIPLDFVFEFHLEDDSNHETPYSGDGVTISFFYTSPEDEQMFESLVQQYSTKKWGKKIAHFTNDGIEFLDATDNDGVWKFTTTSFSAFAPVLKAIEETEPSPQTMDNIPSLIMLGAISTLILTTFSLYFKKVNR